MKKYIFLFLVSPFILAAQSLYNPQTLYDQPGGLFDEDSLRVIDLEFYDSNYHSYLVNSWYYNPDERIPATLTVNGTSRNVTITGNIEVLNCNNVDFTIYLDIEKLLTGT